MLHTDVLEFIYRLSNVGLHFINCAVDPQNSGSNWSLCRDIESFVETKLLVFVAVSVVASCFLLLPVLWACSWIVLRHTLIMSRHRFYSAVLFLSRQECLVSRHPTCLQPASHVLVLLESVATFFSLSRQTFPFFTCQLCRDRVFSVAIGSL